jgi:hypothetical protein
MRLIDYLRLQPYGSALLSPAAEAWIGSARVVILLMASIEGFVWGAVGLSLVPAETRWLGPPIALFLFALMFSVIWIVDASLIMSEKPRWAAHGSPRGGSLRAAGPVMRWLIGLLVRVAIVAISLYVTAPFVEKLIRADDIATWHQAQVERYFDERARGLSEQIETRAGQVDAGYRARIESIEQRIAGLSAELSSARERRDRLSAEYQPEIEVLVADLAEARRRVGDEVLGREGRPEGYGPEARRWDAQADRLEEALTSKRAELAERLAPIEAEIRDLQQRIDEQSQGLAEVRAEEQALLERITREVEAEQPPAAPPELSFAARSKALSELRESPSERGVPHFETVEGFAQAALGILFFSLIALKLFEPTAVQTYYSEAVQTQYPHYLAGGFAEIPGFGQHDDPRRRLSPVEFARRLEQWEREPAAFVAAHRAEVEARARLARLSADEAYERELLSRRHQGIDHQLALEHQEREAELRARERELELQIEQVGARLADETRLQRERDQIRLTQARHEQQLAGAESERAQRERQLAELQQRLEDNRSQLAEQREQQLALSHRLADNQQAIGVTRQRIESLEAAIHARQPALDKLRADLAELERHRAATGASSLFGPLARRARTRRRMIRRAERKLAPDRRDLDAQYGQLGVLEAESEQLQRALQDSRGNEASLRRQCHRLRMKLDALLLAQGRSRDADGNGVVAEGNR